MKKWLLVLPAVVVFFLGWGSLGSAGNEIPDLGGLFTSGGKKLNCDLPVAKNSPACKAEDAAPKTCAAGEERVNNECKPVPAPVAPTAPESILPRCIETANMMQGAGVTNNITGSVTIQGANGESMAMKDIKALLEKLMTIVCSWDPPSCKE